MMFGIVVSASSSAFIAAPIVLFTGQNRLRRRRAPRRPRPRPTIGSEGTRSGGAGAPAVEGRALDCPVRPARLGAPRRRASPARSWPRPSLTGPLQVVAGAGPASPCWSAPRPAPRPIAGYAASPPSSSALPRAAVAVVNRPGRVASPPPAPSPAPAGRRLIGAVATPLLLTRAIEAHAEALLAPARFRRRGGGGAAGAGRPGRDARHPTRAVGCSGAGDTAAWQRGELARIALGRALPLTCCPSPAPRPRARR